MLTKKQTEKYADVMVWGLKKARRRKFKKGDIVSVNYDVAAIPLANAMYDRLIEDGLNIIPRGYMNEPMEYSFYSKGSKKQLEFIGSWEKDYFGSLAGVVSLMAPDSLTHLKDVDTKKITMHKKIRKQFRDIMEENESKGLFGWTLSVCPTEEPARQARLTLKQYTNQIVKACYLNDPDPVATWEEIFNEAIEIKKWVSSLKVKYFHVESNKMDLRIYPGEKRQWLGVSGHNVPSFELFVSPDCRYTEGKYYADIPSFVNGNYVEGLELNFKNGEVISAYAKSGEDFVHKYLDTDKGAVRLGEFALVDKRFSKINKFMANTLFDENFGGPNGSCHIALGMPYYDTYKGDPSTLDATAKKDLGFNDSAIHWDVINSENKTVTAYLTSGKSTVIYEKGSFIH
ncbi:MAG TPA: aminopeptidase [Methanosarcinales archaeon]|nr:aminopeptidase [Methanosarcinales archaeon]